MRFPNKSIQIKHENITLVIDGKVKDNPGRKPKGIQERLCQYRRGARGGSPAWGVVENAEGGWNEGGVPPACKIDFRGISPDTLDKNHACCYNFSVGPSFGPQTAPYPSGKGEVCKTFMHQFDSDRRL